MSVRHRHLLEPRAVLASTVRGLTPVTPTRVTFRCYVYFDKALTPNVLHVTDWHVRINSRVWNLSGPIAEPDRVRVDTDSPGLFLPGIDHVRYTNLHHSLRDVDGLEVADFMQPITRTD